jgi:hypothetical protein
MWLQKREKSCHSLARWISLAIALSTGITISSHTISAFIAIAATRAAISVIDIITSTTVITNITAITAFTVLTAYRAFRTFTKRVEHMITVGVAKCDGRKSNIAPPKGWLCPRGQFFCVGNAILFHGTEIHYPQTKNFHLADISVNRV